MDKYEFNIKVEQIKKLINRGDYATAMKIADTIDWHRVRSASLLSMIAQIYEKNEEYQEAKDILLIAFERAPIGKRLLYKLTELALKEGSVNEATASPRSITAASFQWPKRGTALIYSSARLIPPVKATLPSMVMIFLWSR